MLEKRQGFIGGAVMLMGAVLVVKIIGALFKIPLTAMLGGVGMSYFMTAYGLFTPIYSLSAAGFPAAVSKMISGFTAKGGSTDALRCASVALALFSLIGLVLSGGIFFGAGVFVRMVGNPNALLSVRAIAPALFFGCVAASVRGYYEGCRNMAPTAMSQLTEAATKLVAGIGFAYYLLWRANTEYAAFGTVFGTAVPDSRAASIAALPFAAAGAVCGVTLGTVAGAVFLLVRRAVGGRADRRTEPTMSRAAIARQLLKIALPIALSALAVNVTGVIDLISVMNRLGGAMRSAPGELIASYTSILPDYLKPEDIPGFLYGSYTGMAMTIFNIVPSFTTSLGTSALPLLSGYRAAGQAGRMRRTVESVIRVSAMVAIPAGLGICAMSGPILNFLFPSSPAEAAVSTPLLSAMGIAVIFVAMTPPINSMLQAVGGVYYPVRFMLVGATVKLLCNAMLVGIPAVNIKGAPVGTLLCYSFTFLAGLWSVCSLTGATINVWQTFLKPLAASLACAAGARVSYDTIFKLTGSRASVLVSIMIGGIIYILFILFTKTIKKDDLYDIKSGDKLALLLAKHGFLG